jgi:hypothetical protein
MPLNGKVARGRRVCRVAYARVSRRTSCLHACLRVLAVGRDRALGEEPNDRSGGRALPRHGTLASVASAALLSATSASGDPDAGGRSRRPVADRCSWLLVVSRAWERSTNAPPLAVRREGSVRTVCACPSLSARSSAPARTARLRWAERSSGASGRGDLRVAEAMASVAVELTIVFVRTNVYRGMPRPMSSPVGGRTR